MEGLEDNADRAAAQSRQRILAEGAEVVAVDDDPAARRALEPGKRHQECRLPAPRGPDEADRLAGRDREIDPLEDMDFSGACTKSDMQTVTKN